MSPQDQHHAEFASPLALTHQTKFLIAGVGLVAAVYFSFIAPMQQHMATLQRQCGELTQVVKQLQGKQTAAQEGLQLIALLDSQSGKLAQAEASLESLIAMRQQLIDQAQALESLAERQTGLIGELTSVSGQLSSLEDEIVNRSSNLPHAEQTLGQIDALCQQLADESATVAAARRHVAGLAQLKNEVIEQSAGLNEAAQLLTTIWDLRDGMLRSSETIDAAQKMVVEVMLMQPAMERAVAALQPMSDFHRLSRREKVQPTITSPKTTQAAPQKSSWAEVLKVAVRMLIPLG